MTQPQAEPPVPDDEPTVRVTAEERAPSAAEGGEQWAAADALLEGQPTALGE